MINPHKGQYTWKWIVSYLAKNLLFFWATICQLFLQHKSFNLSRLQERLPFINIQEGISDSFGHQTSRPLIWNKVKRFPLMSLSFPAHGPVTARAEHTIAGSVTLSWDSAYSPLESNGFNVFILFTLPFSQGNIRTNSFLQRKVTLHWVGRCTGHYITLPSADAHCRGASLVCSVLVSATVHSTSLSEGESEGGSSSSDSVLTDSLQAALPDSSKLCKFSYITSPYCICSLIYQVRGCTYSTLTPL